MKKLCSPSVIKHTTKKLTSDAYFEEFRVFPDIPDEIHVFFSVFVHEALHAHFCGYGDFPCFVLFQTHPSKRRIIVVDEIPRENMTTFGRNIHYLIGNEASKMRTKKPGLCLLFGDVYQFSIDVYGSIYTTYRLRKNTESTFSGFPVFSEVPSKLEAEKYYDMINTEIITHVATINMETKKNIITLLSRPDIPPFAEHRMLQDVISRLKQ